MTHTNQVMDEPDGTDDIRESLDEIYAMERASEALDRWYDEQDLDKEIVENGDPHHDRSGDSPGWLFDRVEYISSKLVRFGAEQVAKKPFNIVQDHMEGSFERKEDGTRCVQLVKRWLEEALEDLIKGVDSVKNGKLPRKQPGRKKADYETVKWEDKIAAEWERMKAAGVAKVEFAKEKKYSVSGIKNLLDRVYKRKVRSDN